MPLFVYQTFSEKQKIIESTILAENLQDAKLKLVRLQIKAFAIYPMAKKQVVFNSKEILLLTKEIYRLLEAGLPLFDTLSALEEKYRGDKVHDLLILLLEEIQKGSSFSDALSGHPKSFSIIYRTMIQNGEKTGSLIESLEAICTLLEKQISLKKQIISAILYPSMLMIFSIVIFSVLLLFVIPSLSELFEGRSLPPFTAFIFGLSQCVCKMKYWFLGGIFILGGVLTGCFFSPSWKKQILHFVLRFPLCKNFFIKAAIIRFVRALSTLLEGGMPLINALSQARSLMEHPALEKVIEAAEQRIEQGESISAPFRNQPLIPPLIPRMLGIAEQSSKLSFTMQQIGQIYEEELDASLAQFTAVAQPVLLLVLGAIVGFILLAVLLPLTDMSSFISN